MHILEMRLLTESQISEDRIISWVAGLYKRGDKKIERPQPNLLAVYSLYATDHRPLATVHCFYRYRSSRYVSTDVVFGR